MTTHDEPASRIEIPCDVPGCTGPYRRSAVIPRETPIIVRLCPRHALSMADVISKWCKDNGMWEETP